MTKGLMESNDEGVRRWFGHVEGMENGRIAKRVYVRECIVSDQGEARGRGGLITRVTA